jgi:hypothetical protein
MSETKVYEWCTESGDSCEAVSNLRTVANASHTMRSVTNLRNMFSAVTVALGKKSSNKETSMSVGWRQ